MSCVVVCTLSLLLPSLCCCYYCYDSGSTLVLVWLWRCAGENKILMPKPSADLLVQMRWVIGAAGGWEDPSPNISMRCLLMIFNIRELPWFSTGTQFVISSSLPSLTSTSKLAARYFTSSPDLCQPYVIVS